MNKNFQTRKSIQDACIFLFLPFVAAAVGCALLFLASLVPENAIRENCLKSAEELMAMDGNLAALPSSEDFSYYYDPHTDRLIIMEAYTLRSDEPGSVLLNPYFAGQEKQEHSDFTRLLNGEAETNVNYVRYWQGFRILIRPLLAVSSYLGILEISSIAFFLLFALTVIFAANKYGKMTAALLGLSVALFKPGVIAFSLQYVFCFLLMFVFTIVVLGKHISPSRAPLLFCIFGMATQFFDFYTVPPITYGLPVLMLLMDDGYRDKRWRTVLKTFGAWLYGYISLWLLKLALVSLLPGVNGFKDGFSSLQYRLGANGNFGNEAFGQIKSALINVWWMSCPGENELLVFLGLVLLVAVGAFRLWKHKGVAALLSCGAFLAVAAIPVVWTVIAARPMNIHAWFQYRIFLPVYAGIFLFFAKSWQECRRLDK